MTTNQLSNEPIAQLGKVAAFTSICLGMLFAGWYLLTLIEVVKHDLADLFGIVILLTLPFSCGLFIFQLFAIRQAGYRSKFMITGTVFSFLLLFVSSFYWFELLSFFSSLDGFGLGST